uniref:Serine protease n=1 Tax=Ascaris lumbricoides TaxID=6252 RepID=A0A0M3HW60_ASCLU
MVESAAIKKLTQPKVAASICIAVVLVVVGALFAAYYIRNPTFASDMFMTVTTTPNTAHIHVDRNATTAAGRSGYSPLSNSSATSTQGEKPTTTMNDDLSQNSSSHT